MIVFGLRQPITVTWILTRAFCYHGFALLLEEAMAGSMWSLVRGSAFNGNARLLWEEMWLEVRKNDCE